MGQQDTRTLIFRGCLDNMTDINKYIGIPFKKKGFDFDGVDCYGLVWLFYREEFGMEMPSFGAYDINEDPKEVARQMNINIPLLIGDQTDTPVFGDAVLFRFRNIPNHMGIYVGNGRVLHVMKGTFSTCESINSCRLKGKLDGYYELRQENKIKCSTKSV